MNAWLLLRAMSAALVVSALAAMMFGWPFGRTFLGALAIVTVRLWFQLCSTLKDRA